MKFIGADSICQICLRVIIPDPKFMEVTYVCECSNPANVVHSECLVNYNGPPNIFTIYCERCKLKFTNKNNPKRFILYFNNFYQWFYRIFQRYEKNLFLISALYFTIYGNPFLKHILNKYNINIIILSIAFYLNYDLNTGICILYLLDIFLPMKVYIAILTDYVLLLIHSKITSRFEKKEVICHCFINRICSVKVYLKDDTCLYFPFQLIYLKIPFFILINYFWFKSEMSTFLSMVVITIMFKLIIILCCYRTKKCINYIIPLFKNK